MVFIIHFKANRAIADFGITHSEPVIATLLFIAVHKTNFIIKTLYNLAALVPGIAEAGKLFPASFCFLNYFTINFHERDF
jgi:hypothetical protein